MAQSKHHANLNEGKFISKCWCFLTARKHLADVEGSCFLHRKTLRKYVLDAWFYISTVHFNTFDRKPARPAGNLFPEGKCLPLVFPQKYLQLLNKDKNSRVWKFRGIYNYNMSFAPVEGYWSLWCFLCLPRCIWENRILLLGRCAILWDRFDGGVFWWKRAQLVIK